MVFNKLKEKDIEELKLLIEENSGYLANEIKFASSLNKSSYGMSDYEADLFLDKVYSKYNIKFPKNFDTRAYFFPDTLGGLPNFINKWLGITPTPKNKNVNITFKHILDIIEKGVWYDPE